MSIITKLCGMLIYGHRWSTPSYIKFLKKQGVKIGENFNIFNPQHTLIDVQNPHLLTIGDDVNITGPVTILTHDYSWCVLKRIHGEILGKQKKVIIGNKIFIGWGATILPGTVIGDNVIIGANSVVSGHLEGNHVYAGNPAKKIISIDEFYNKRKKNQLKEAVEFVHCFKERYGHWPEESDLREYFYLFSDGDNLNSDFIFQMQLQRNYNESLEKLKFSNEKPFRSYKEFLEHCKKSMLI